MRSMWKTKAEYSVRAENIRDTFFFETYTVTDDNPGDILDGGAGLDWFWGNLNEVDELDVAGGEMLG
jgi:hypothetical protein